MRKIQIAGCPKRRDSGVVSQEFDAEDGTIVLDLASNTAHRLEPLAASIWSLCDGSHGILDIAAGAHTTVPVVEEALSQLYALGLLEDEQTGRYTRRKVMVRGAQIGVATAIAMPLIESQALATSAAAFSTGHLLTITGSTGAYSGDSQSGITSGTFALGSPYNLTVQSPDHYTVATGAGSGTYIGLVLISSTVLAIDNESGLSITITPNTTSMNPVASGLGTQRYTFTTSITIAF